MTNLDVSYFLDRDGLWRARVRGAELPVEGVVVASGTPDLFAALRLTAAEVAAVVDRAEMGAYR